MLVFFACAWAVARFTRLCYVATQPSLPPPCSTPYRFARACAVRFRCSRLLANHYTLELPEGSWEPKIEWTPLLWNSQRTHRTANALQALRFVLWVHEVYFWRYDFAKRKNRSVWKVRDRYLRSPWRFAQGTHAGRRWPKVWTRTGTACACWTVFQAWGLQRLCVVLSQRARRIQPCRRRLLVH